MRPSEYLGERTSAALRSNRKWALAQALDALLYDGRCDQSPVYVGDAAEVHGLPRVDSTGKDDPAGAYVDPRRAVRQAMHELEAMAVREVT